MKKTSFVFVVLITFFVLFYNISISAFAVDIDNINYNIDYKTHVNGYSSYYSEGNTHTIKWPKYYECFNENITDFSSVRGLKEYKEKTLKILTTDLNNSTLTNCTTADRPFIDGYIYEIPDESIHLYLNFFDLPANFNGTKEILKEDVCFKVFGDGQGKFSMTVISDIIGTKTKTFIVPAKSDITINEGLTLETYTVYYYDKQGSFKKSTGTSLDEVLTHCSKMADINKTINILAEKSYSLSIDAKISYEMILNVTYGNQNKISNKPSNLPIESSTNQQSTISKDPVSSEEIHSHFPEQSEIDTETIKDETPTKAQSNNAKNIITYIVIFAAVFVIGGATFWTIKIISKKKK